MNGYIGTQNGIVRAPGLKGRGAAQNKRYKQGVQSGELNHVERAVLKGTRAANRATLNEAKASGAVSGQERLALHQDLTNTSKLLFAFKHN
jgi:hypothetical protein